MPNKKKLINYAPNKKDDVKDFLALPDENEILDIEGEEDIEELEYEITSIKVPMVSDAESDKYSIYSMAEDYVDISNVTSEEEANKDEPGKKDNEKVFPTNLSPDTLARHSTFDQPNYLRSNVYYRECRGKLKIFPEDCLPMPPVRTISGALSQGDYPPFSKAHPTTPVALFTEDEEYDYACVAESEATLLEHDYEAKWGKFTAFPSEFLSPPFAMTAQELDWGCKCLDMKKVKSCTDCKLIIQDIIGELSEYNINMDETLQDLKLKLSVRYNVPFYSICISNSKGKVIEDTLNFHCVNHMEGNRDDFMIIEIAKNKEMRVPYKLMVMTIVPSIIAVSTTIAFDVNQTSQRIQKITIERSPISKQYLGGYIDRISCREFHHAESQTWNKLKNCPLGKAALEELHIEALKKIKRSISLGNERGEGVTYSPMILRKDLDAGEKSGCFLPHIHTSDKYTTMSEQRNLTQQTAVDEYTQMTGTGVFVSNQKDKLLPIGKYITSIEFLEDLVNKIVIIQKYYRRWLSRRTIEILFKIRDRISRWEIEKEAKYKLKYLKSMRVPPRSNEDFDLLYVQLEKWRLIETAKLIDKFKNKAERAAALAQLLEDESKFIRCIGEMQLAIQDDMSHQKQHKYLNKVSAPISRRNDQGQLITVDTWYKIESRYLITTHDTMNLNSKFLTMPYERVSVLLTVKNILKNYICNETINLVEELLDLIEREALSTVRGLRYSRMLGLRRRINNLFLEFIRHPKVNPAMNVHNKIAYGVDNLKLYRTCLSCNRRLHLTHFQMTSYKLHTSYTCKQCERCKNVGSDRRNYTIFADMLKDLRKDEKNYDDNARIVFFMQEKDIRHLVTSIWLKRSIISKDPNLENLVLVRWNVLKEWSPWNSFLVTRDEANLHLQIKDIYESYSKDMIQKVNFMHIYARKDFHSLICLVENKLKTHKKINLPSLVQCPEGVPRNKLLY